MSKKGPIVIVEDDLDDQHILEEVIGSLGFKNELLFYADSTKALDYLKSTTEDPFIIISDVNLPGMSGPDFKKAINLDPRLLEKCIPFVFFTTAANPAAIREAYDMQVQGYFQKGNSFDELTSMLGLILNYWMVAKLPDTEEKGS